MTALYPRPLTADAFAPFGTVTELPPDSKGVTAIGVGHAFAASDQAPQPVLNLVRVETAPQPPAITQLEIHPFSAQSFLALDGAPSLILVGRTDAQGQPDPDTFLAFVARPDQVVTYDLGVLHHRLTPLRAPANFAMAMRQTGTGGDTILLDLPSPVQVLISADVG